MLTPRNTKQTRFTTTISVTRFMATRAGRALMMAARRVQRVHVSAQASGGTAPPTITPARTPEDQLDPLCALYIPCWSSFCAGGSLVRGVDATRFQVISHPHVGTRCVVAARLRLSASTTLLPTSCGSMHQLSKSVMQASLLQGMTGSRIRGL